MINIDVARGQYYVLGFIFGNMAVALLLVWGYFGYLLVLSLGVVVATVIEAFRNDE